jgi:hypothetical protein
LHCSIFQKSFVVCAPHQPRTFRLQKGEKVINYDDGVDADDHQVITARSKRLNAILHSFFSYWSMERKTERSKVYRKHSPIQSMNLVIGRTEGIQRFLHKRSCGLLLSHGITLHCCT